MDRQAHEFAAAAAAAMAFAQQQQQQQAQQQQQFGFHSQHQQFPQQVHGPPFLAPHPSLQQFPFHRHLPPPPPQQLLPHAQHHLPHMLQPPHSFPPSHLPPHIVHPPFQHPFESAPPPAPAPPPSDPELHKVIDKLVEYAAKNGPEFEAMIREKQRDNPAYGFLFGGEGHNYYHYKLWLSTRPANVPFNPSFASTSMPIMHPPNSMLNPVPLNAQAAGASPSILGASQMHQPSFPPFYDQQQPQHSQPFLGQVRPDFDPSTKPFKGLSGPLPSDVASELNSVLNNLSGTKESIKGAKIWFMQRSPFAPALSEALRDKVLALDDSERQLHIIYLANDILFDSLQRRVNPHDVDNEALAFKPVMGSMLARIYHNPHNKEGNQARLQKILQFWASKEVYDSDTIYAFESEMLGGPPSFPSASKDLSNMASDPIGLTQQTALQGLNQWQGEKQRSSLPGSLDQDQLDKQMPIAASLFAPPLGHQFLPSSGPTSLHPSSLTVNPFAGSASVPPSIPPPNQQPGSNLMPAQSGNLGEKLPPYPLFPPGLIPGMVRKMQIGSGVPYSPMSPLDIPTVIPPSTVSPSEILDRVSKFFKEIGEVNPSEGPMQPSDSNEDDDTYEYEREQPVRKGGARIPPPPNLQADPETGTYPDGTVERKPGSSSSGRLGLGATANPNEVSQYDDVYTSYRKQRSTNYHTSMSARASAR
ncbi:hypothetical protein Sjap_003338 [Stephania japonica]|uniref:Calcium homeostasis endoplasmic reticulum protein n=1 Tax=Stephania japonica TaxID=461633 RepID=A0AAP0PTF9_9MAGN